MGWNGKRRIVARIQRTIKKRLKSRLMLGVTYFCYAFTVDDQRPPQRCCEEVTRLTADCQGIFSLKNNWVYLAVSYINKYSKSLRVFPSPHQGDLPYMLHWSNIITAIRPSPMALTDRRTGTKKPAKARLDGFFIPYADRNRPAQAGKRRRSTQPQPPPEEPQVPQPPPPAGCRLLKTKLALPSPRSWKSISTPRR